MNLAMTLLRKICGEQEAQQEIEQGITLTIDPVEEPGTTVYSPALTAKWSVLKNTPTARKMSQKLADAANAQYDATHTFIKNSQELLKSEGAVWIYSISPIEVILRGSIVKELIIPALEKGKEYAVVTRLPKLFELPRYAPEEGDVRIVIEDGRRIAMDLINPNNLTLDQDKEINGNITVGLGNDFSKRGIFWSEHNPPLKKDLAAAHRRMRKHYKGIMELVHVMELTTHARRAIEAADKVGIPGQDYLAAEKYLSKTQETQ